MFHKNPLAFRRRFRISFKLLFVCLLEKYQETRHKLEIVRKYISQPPIIFLAFRRIALTKACYSGVEVSQALLLSSSAKKINIYLLRLLSVQGDKENSSCGLRIGEINLKDISFEEVLAPQTSIYL